MYNIHKINEDRYQLHSDRTNSLMEGALIHIMVYATHTLGFNPDELEMAFVDMIRNDKDSAHFGIYKAFIFSFNKADREKKAG